MFVNIDSLNDGTKVLDIDDTTTGDDGIDHTLESTVERLKENMARAYQWTTSTQRYKHTHTHTHTTYLQIEHALYLVYIH